MVGISKVGIRIDMMQTGIYRNADDFMAFLACGNLIYFFSRTSHTYRSFAGFDEFITQISAKFHPLVGICSEACFAIPAGKGSYTSSRNTYVSNIFQSQIVRIQISDAFSFFSRTSQFSGEASVATSSRDVSEEHLRSSGYPWREPKHSR